MTDDDDFLSRWSRRKRKVEAEEATPAAAEAPPAEVPEPESEEEEAALLAKLGLPKPESLGPGDDFRVFMAKGVPAFLRRRALRVLWRSNPVLANLDGLNDYDDDFTSPELTKKVLATAYQVGRGVVSRNIEDPPSDDAVSDDLAPSEVAQGHPEEVAEKDETAEVREVSREADEPQAEPRPRRMRFET